MPADDATGYSPLIMDYEELKKSLWHAFDILDKSSQAGKTRTTQVPKTKLRVLTNNLGHVLNVDQAETIWDKVSFSPVNFDQFISVLTNNLLIGLTKTSDPYVVSLRSNVDKLCWMLCEKSYKERISSTSGDGGEEEGKTDRTQREFSSDDSFKLWKIFNFLCEWGADGKMLVPLRVDVEETERLASEILRCVGLPPPEPVATNNRVSMIEGSFLQDFSEFICMLAQKIGNEEPADTISQGISEVYMQTMADIVRKGQMVKFGNKVTAWKERWFVLSAKTLSYYSTPMEKDLKGTITLCKECSTQAIPEKAGSRQHRFKLKTQGKLYELSAPDLRSKNEWMSAIKRVVSNIDKTNESLQRVSWMERRKEREDRRRRTAEEELRRLEEKERLLERERELEEERKQRLLAEDEIKERERLLALEQKKREEEEERRRQETQQLLSDKMCEIEAEKKRFAEIEQRLQEEREALKQSFGEALTAEREQRAHVEERLREEEAVLEEERRRLRELEEAKASLEALVEEERALKRDEEIVRNLQSKILEEEFAKRAELEKLQEEQRQQLLQEQLSRQELEAIKRSQEEELQAAQRQLEELGLERENAEEKVKEATDKLSQAEAERQKLEHRLKLRDTVNITALAKPLPKPEPSPFVTHRGFGAFCEAEFAPSPPFSKRVQVPEWDDSETQNGEGQEGLENDLVTDSAQKITLNDEGSDHGL